MRGYDSTDTDRDSQASGFRANRDVRNRTADPFSNGVEVLWVAIGKYRQKLFSSVAPQGIIRAQNPIHTICDFPQHGIASQMAVGVVDSLEMVQVHHHDSCRHSGASPSLQFTVEYAQDCGTTEYPG